MSKLRAFKFSKKNCLDDKGSSSVILAILFSSFFISGLFMIVIDNGLLYLERRTLQNAADATVLAVAQECAELSNLSPTSPVLCRSDNLAAATEIAGKNSNDDKTTVIDVCGKGSRLPGLADCNASSARRFDCRDQSLDGFDQYVRVRTRTLSTEGRPFLNLYFAPFVIKSLDGVYLEACSQAVWGAAESAPVVYPLTLPICGYSDNASKEYSAYFENEPLTTPADNCAYTPIGSSSSVPISVPVVKGMAMFLAINGNELTCPTIFQPVEIKLGDILTPLGGKADTIEISRRCSETLNKLGYNSPNREQNYSGYLKDFVLGKTLYVPVVTSLDCPSPEGCKRLKVGAFYSVVVIGIDLKNSMAVGHGENGPRNGCTSGDCWKPTDCANDTYCFYGKFTRTSPPHRPKPANPEAPNTGVSRIELRP